MRFRPCIDIHNGKVKQIVGSSLSDQGDKAADNFVSGQEADHFAKMYHDSGLTGGHVILLNPSSSPYYESTRDQAFKALGAYPGELMAGGGINADNAAAFLEAGASHVIVTSFVFREGRIDRQRLAQMTDAVGRDHLVLDLSCRASEGGYRIVTDRWQKESEELLSLELLDELAASCSEFLVHAVDAEGKMAGPERTVVRLLSEASREGIVSTYAGGIRSYEDIALIGEEGQGRVDYTVGSALDIFGGPLSYQEIVDKYSQKNH